MDILEELESIAELTGGGSDVFKKVAALVNYLQIRNQQLTAECNQLKSIGQSASSTNAPLGGTAVKRIEFCRCDETTSQEFNDCGCAFGQCAKGLIY